MSLAWLSSRLNASSTSSVRTDTRAPSWPFSSRVLDDLTLPS